MWDEIVICWRMTPKGAFQWPPKRSQSWIHDRHLRNGFLLGLPVFYVGVVWAQSVLRPSPAQFGVMFAGAIASNIVWLTYAAWSRERDRVRDTD
jgi:hypothetical protein